MLEVLQTLASAKFAFECWQQCGSVFCSVRHADILKGPPLLKWLWRNGEMKPTVEKPKYWDREVGPLWPVLSEERYAWEFRRLPSLTWHRIQASLAAAYFELIHWLDPKLRLAVFPQTAESSSEVPPFCTNLHFRATLSEAYQLSVGPSTYGCHHTDTMGQFFLSVFRFPPVSIIPPLLQQTQLGIISAIGTSLNNTP